MKFNLVAFGLAIEVALLVWSLTSICAKLHISRTEVLFGSKEVTTDLVTELIVLIISAAILSYSLLSRLIV